MGMGKEKRGKAGTRCLRALRTRDHGEFRVKPKRKIKSGVIFVVRRRSGSVIVAKAVQAKQLEKMLQEKGLLTPPTKKRLFDPAQWLKRILPNQRGVMGMVLMLHTADFFGVKLPVPKEDLENILPYVGEKTLSIIFRTANYFGTNLDIAGAISRAQATA